MRKVASANYRINWGDTLWRIAERYYGERGLYRELAENNVLNDPDLIIAGKSLQLPSTLAGRRRRIGGQ
jgi:nucleoid-associated protein YgaU